MMYISVILHGEPYLLQDPAVFEKVRLAEPSKFLVYLTNTRRLQIQNRPLQQKEVNLGARTAYVQHFPQHQHGTLERGPLHLNSAQVVPQTLVQSISKIGVVEVDLLVYVIRSISMGLETQSL